MIPVSVFSDEQSERGKMEEVNQLEIEGRGSVPASGAADRPRSAMNDRAAQLNKRYRRNKARRQNLAEQLYGASQYQLMRVKFKKHQVAVVSLYLLGLFYLVAIFAEFFVPYTTTQRFGEAIYASPTEIHFFNEEGQLTTPFFYSTRSKLDPATFRYEPAHVEDAGVNRIVFFAKTEPYTLAGFIPMNRRFYAVEGDYPLLLLGADHLGRDLFSRIIYASRVSLFVGFGGVIISFFLGILLGGISGFWGGTVDVAIQRFIELLMSIPQIPLWMALSAAIPTEWTGIQTYFAITLVLSLVGWTGLARVVRGKVLALREEDYVTAARISSASNLAIIFRHLLPGITSYLVVHVTIAIPYMILGETTLSFLGLGIRAPDVSWGSLLQQAQDVTVIVNYPWLLLPAAFVVAAVVLFNFVGDGLRDAADPYSR
jgi:peptide/nickel transport system permease protein